MARLKIPHSAENCGLMSHDTCTDFVPCKGAVREADSEAFSFQKKFDLNI